MSDFVNTREVNLQKDIPINEVMAAVQASLPNQFDKYVQKSPSCFSARVKTRFFNQIVTLNGEIKVTKVGSLYKILIESNAKTNTGFWITVVLCLCFLTIVSPLLIIWLWFSQKKKCYESLEKALSQAEYNLISYLNNSTQTSAMSGVENIELLDRLHKLKQNGAISEEEYQDKKRKLIA